MEKGRDKENIEKDSRERSDRARKYGASGSRLRRMCVCSSRGARDSGRGEKMFTRRLALRGKEVVTRRRPERHPGLWVDDRGSRGCIYYVLALGPQRRLFCLARHEKGRVGYEEKPVRLGVVSSGSPPRREKKARTHTCASV